QHFTGEQLGDWSPDGRHLNVYLEDADSDLHLSVIDTLDETVWEYADGEVVRDTRWSPDGRYIIFQSIHLAFTFQRDIYAFDVVEETLHPLTDVPVLPGHFTWSTMEHRVAFAANDGTLATPFTTLWIYDLEQQSSQRFD